MALLVTMEALPLSYNRDIQEDKEGLFDTLDTLLSTLAVFTGMVKTLRVKAENTQFQLVAHTGFAIRCPRGSF